MKATLERVVYTQVAKRETVQIDFPIFRKGKYDEERDFVACIFIGESGNPREVNIWIPTWPGAVIANRIASARPMTTDDVLWALEHQDEATHDEFFAAYLDASKDRMDREIAGVLSNLERHAPAEARAMTDKEALLRVLAALERSLGCTHGAMVCKIMETARLIEDHLGIAPKA